MGAVINFGQVAMLTGRKCVFELNTDGTWKVAGVVIPTGSSSTNSCIGFIFIDVAF